MKKFLQELLLIKIEIYKTHPKSYMNDVLQENGQMRKRSYAAAMNDVIKCKKTTA